MFSKSSNNIFHNFEIEFYFHLKRNFWIAQFEGGGNLIVPHLVVESKGLETEIYVAKMNQLL